MGPVGISLVCHVFLVGVFALATWAVGTADEPVFTEYKAMVVAQHKGEAYRFPGRANADRPDSARAAHEAETIEDLSALLGKEAAFKLAPADSGGSGLEDVAFRELGRSDVLGTGTGGGVGAGGLGSGLGDRNRAGGGPVGTLWGVGEGQRARSIVYVMDRSGSMGDAFVLLQRELLRAIGSLQDDQLFNVIWFNEGPGEELSKRLMAATIPNKRKAFKAIKRIVPSGQTEPVDAIRKGLGYRPDVLFLLSDGDFGKDNRDIFRVIRKKNAKRAVIINTILFVYDVMGEGERVLREIAEENGGTFKHVTEQDLEG